MNQYKKWFNEGKEKKHKFISIVLDTYDYEEYPEYSEERKFIEHFGKNMQRFICCFDLSLDFDKQLKILIFPKREEFIKIEITDNELLDNKILTIQFPFRLKSPKLNDELSHALRRHIEEIIMAYKLANK